MKAGLSISILALIYNVSAIELSSRILESKNSIDDFIPFRVDQNEID